MSSYRVRKDIEGVWLGGHLAVERNGKWRLYEAKAEYSSTSGGFIERGKAVRRYDPNAGINEGKIAIFASLEDAEAYFDRWIKPHVKEGDLYT